MIPLLSTVGSQAAISLRDMLMGIPFLLCVVGIVERGWNSENKPKELFNSILVTLIVVGLIIGFPTALNELKDGFLSVRQDFSQIPLIEKLYEGEIQESGVPSKWDIGNYFCYVGVVAMQRMGVLSIKLIEWFQEFAINGLIAVSPILLGFLATSFTRSIGINFLMTSLGVVMWHLGFAIVDLVLYHFSGQILAAAGLSAVASGTALAFGLIGWPWALAGMLLVVIVSNALYLSVPIVVQALLKGANPATTAFAAGVQGAATAIGMGVGAKFALGQIGSQQMATAALSNSLGTEGVMAPPLNNQSARIHPFTNLSGTSSNDSSSSNGIAASESANSSIPSPPSIKPFTADIGASVEHAGYTATQTDSDKFTVSNNKSGSISESNGNIGSPQDLMAGINMHEVKVKQDSYFPASSTTSISQQRQDLDQKLNS